MKKNIQHSFGLNNLEGNNCDYYFTLKSVICMSVFLLLRLAVFSLFWFKCYLNVNINLLVLSSNAMQILLQLMQSTFYK